MGREYLFELASDFHSFLFSNLPWGELEVINSLFSRFFRTLIASTPFIFCVRRPIGKENEAVMVGGQVYENNLGSICRYVLSDLLCEPLFD